MSLLFETQCSLLIIPSSFSYTPITTAELYVFVVKQEGKYAVKVSKRTEEDHEAEELRRKKSVAERSLLLFLNRRYIWIKIISKYFWNYFSVLFHV